MHFLFRWGICFFYRWQTERAQGPILETIEFDISEMSRTVGPKHLHLVPRTDEISTPNSRLNVGKLKYEEEKKHHYKPL